MLDFIKNYINLAGEQFFWQSKEKMLYLQPNLTKNIYLKLLDKYITANNKFSLAKNYSNPSLSRSYFGLLFGNPIGLAPFIDISGRHILNWQSLGFGFVEIGPVFLEEKLFESAITIKKRLASLKNKSLVAIPVGASLGQSLNEPSLVGKEILKTYQTIYDVIDYVCIDIPVFLDASLNRQDELAKILDPICNFNDSLKDSRPISLRLSSSCLSNEDVISVLELAVDYKILGISVSAKMAAINTVHYNEKSELRFDNSTQLLRCIAKDYKDKFVLIASGGISDGKSAIAKINAGANLLQIHNGVLLNGFTFVQVLLKSIASEHC